MDRTLIICKPDAVERGLVGEILGRFERKGLKLAAGDPGVLDGEPPARHYAEHQGKPFYNDLVAFMNRGPVLVAVVEGVPETWRVARQMIGATDPLAADPGTIRGDLGNQFTENLIHGSDSGESAEREIAIFFPDLSRG